MRLVTWFGPPTATRTNMHSGSSATSTTLTMLLRTPICERFGRCEDFGASQTSERGCTELLRTRPTAFSTVDEGRARVHSPTISTSWMSDCPTTPRRARSWGTCATGWCKRSACYRKNCVRCWYCVISMTFLTRRSPNDLGSPNLRPKSDSTGPVKSSVTSCSASRCRLLRPPLVPHLVFQLRVCKVIQPTRRVPSGTSWLSAIPNSAAIRR